MAPQNWKEKERIGKKSSTHEAQKDPNLCISVAYIQTPQKQTGSGGHA